jgi:hypothetical protein
MNLLVGSLLLLVIVPACTTPPEIKQAVVAKDVAYAENARLMNIHRELLVSIDTRYWYWYRYAKKLALLDQAMKWATTDPEPPAGQTKENHASLVLLSLLGMKPVDPAKPDPLLTAINRMRLRDLPERKGKNDSVVFEKGRSDMNGLVQGIPELIDAIQKKVETEYTEEMKAADYSAFDDYQTNLAALRRINGMIKRYLDIDVTVKRDDVEQLAESVNALR